MRVLMKSFGLMLMICFAFSILGCSSSDSELDGDTDFNLELDPDVETEMDMDVSVDGDMDLDRDSDPHTEMENDLEDGDPDTEIEESESEIEEQEREPTFSYPRPEEPLYGDCIPGVAACSEDRRTGYLCDPYGRWMLWAEYRDPVECSICSDYMGLETRTVDGKMFNPTCVQFLGDFVTRNRASQRPYHTLHITENWEETDAYDCFGEGYREFDPIVCNEGTGNLEIPYSGDRVTYKTQDWEEEPDCSYRLEIPCQEGCLTEESNQLVSYYEELQQDYENAHCVNQNSMVNFNPDPPAYLMEGLACDIHVCDLYDMRCYHGICIPDDSPYCMRWDNENDCPAGKDCIDGICQPFDPNNVPQPPDGDLDQEPDADPDPETDGDGELVTEADETETELE